MTIPNDKIANIRKHLQVLKLKEIDRVLDEHLSAMEKNNLTCIEVLEKLFETEAVGLIERRIERRIRESRLPARKLLCDFDFDFQTGVDKSQIMNLASLSFVERKEWLVFAGASGTGKSHLSMALLLLGCQKSYRCRYTTASEMLRVLLSGMADDTLEQKLKIYVRPEILLIDEIGFDRLEQKLSQNAFLFFKVIEGRYCKQTTILTTNIDFKSLGDYLGDPVVTASLVDRIIHHAVIINIDGPSYRMHESKLLNQSSEKDDR